MGKYRKRPVVIEAMQLTGGAVDRQVARWIESNGGKGSEPFLSSAEHVLSILTLEGEMRAAAGDWVIRGVKGEFYPCKSDIFEATYEPAD